MLRSFWIHDNYKNSNVAILTYDTYFNEFKIELNSELTAASAPIYFDSFVAKGIQTLDDKSARVWIKGRIIPPSRQNIRQCLDALKLKEYDMFTMLISNNGKSSQDDMVLIERNKNGNDNFERA